MKVIYPKTGNSEILVDDDMYEELSSVSWHISPQGYAKRNPSKLVGGNMYTLMHRMVLGVSDRKMQVDHIDGNRLNNQRANLRIADFQTNQANRGLPVSNTSGYKGVTFDSPRNRWVAQIMYNRKHLFLGRYETPEEAAQAYNVRAKSLFGEFANLNTIGDKE